MKAVIKGEEIEIPYNSIYSCVEHAISKYREKIAFKFDNEYSYLDINKRINKAANYLKNAGIRSGQVVGVDLNKGIDFVICVFALMKLHAVCMMLGENILKSNFEFYINDANISHVISASKTEEWNFGNLINFELKDYEDYSELNEEIDFEKVNGLECSLDDEAFIFYTSGTTGAPKRVSISHGNILNDTSEETARPELWENDIFLLTSPKASLRITGEIFYPFFWGIKNVICSDETSKNVKELLSIMISEKITVFFAVPTMLRELIKFKSFLNNNNLRIIQSLGELLDEDLIKTIYSQTAAKIYNIYGQTEAGMCSTYLVQKEDFRFCCGMPVPNRNLYVLDGNSEPTENGVEGDIYVSGKYLNYKKDNTANVVNLGEEDLYSTGDRGYITETGLLVHCGRSDDVCKIGGMRVNLNDVTDAVLKIPVISNALAFEYKSEKKHYIVCAYEAKGRGELTRKEMVNKLDKIIPTYMIPSRFIYIDKIPVNSSGKINRIEAQMIAIKKIEERQQIEFSINEKKIMEIVGENVISLDFSKTLAENGLNSLQIITIYSELEEHFVRPVDIIDMKEITVEELLWNID